MLWLLQWALLHRDHSLPQCQFASHSLLTLLSGERIVFLWDCQRWWSLISMSMAWNCSWIQPVILKWFTSFIVWISPLFPANSVCENVHSCIYQGFLHLTGLAGSHLSFIRRILQTRTPWEGIKPCGCCYYNCCSSVCHCWEAGKCCAPDPPWGTRVPSGGWMSLSLCPSSPLLQLLLMKNQQVLTVQQPGQSRAAQGCDQRLLGDSEAGPKWIKQGYQYFPHLKPLCLLIPQGSGISC